MSEWKEYKLGELIADKSAELQTGPFGTMLNASEYVIDGTPVIAVQDIGENKLIYHKFVFVNDSTALRLSRYRVKENDIIFGRKGAVERRALIKKREEGWLQGSDCIRLRFSDKVEPKFASYQFGTKYNQDWMFQNAGGATMPSLNQNVLKELPIRFPSLPEQRAIASVLSSLDDKIDLLHRQNQTLEKMAETLFRQWFVEEAKEEWQEGTLKELVETANTGLDAIQRAPIVLEETGIKCLRIQDISQQKPFHNWGNSKVKESDFEKARLRKDDIIMARTCSPGIIYFVRDDLNAVFNNGLAPIRPNKEKTYSIFLYIFLKLMILLDISMEYLTGLQYN